MFCLSFRTGPHKSCHQTCLQSVPPVPVVVRGPQQGVTVALRSELAQAHRAPAPLRDLYGPGVRAGKRGSEDTLLAWQRLHLEEGI